MSEARATDPIIVFGAPRSGTSYLNRIVNEHPKVYVSGESRLFVWAHRSIHVVTEDKKAILTHRDKFIDHLLATYPDLIRDFYRSIAPHVRWWGDKNPHYGGPENRGCLETIAALFPRAKFVQIVRDGRAVVASRLRKGWGTFDGNLDAWAAHVEIGCRFGASLPEDRYHELRYEDLVEDDEGSARRLFEFLEIPMHSAVIEFCESQQVQRTPVSDPTRDFDQDITKPDWESVLTPDQRQEALRRLGPILVRLGYEHESSRTGSGEASVEAG